MKDRYLIQHSRGYLNVDEHVVYFSEDGNWGNIPKEAPPSPEEHVINSLKEAQKDPSKTIGYGLAIASAVFLVLAGGYFSIVSLFLCVSTAYLSWASLRVPEISGFSVPKHQVTKVKQDVNSLFMTVSFDNHEPLNLELRKISETHLGVILKDLSDE